MRRNEVVQHLGCKMLVVAKAVDIDRVQRSWANHLEDGGLGGNMKDGLALGA